MARFLELKRPNGKRTLLNLDLILAITEKDDGTTDVVIDGETIDVPKEVKYEDIVNKLQRMQ